MSRRGYYAITTGDDIYDSRDIIDRLEVLNEWRDAAMDADTLEAADKEDGDGTWTAEDGTVYANTGDWDEDTEREYKALSDLNDNANYGDWQHGETLIADHYFEKYAEQLAEDIGVIDRNARWPLSCIDWAEAARELQQDYTEVDFDGHSYWIRS